MSPSSPGVRPFFFFLVFNFVPPVPVQREDGGSELSRVKVAHPPLDFRCAPCCVDIWLDFAKSPGVTRAFVQRKMYLQKYPMHLERGLGQGLGCVSQPRLTVCGN